jgi:phospholipid/cholesterol/gamma-HCH transport system ATP-binding protein
VTDALFEIRGLEKSYGDRQVLAGIDFTVRRGECLVILGRSGSGKSVMLRQLNGLEPPDAGEVRFDGLPVSGLSERELFPIRRRIGMLFQGGALFDSFDIFDNVAFPLREHTALSEPEIETTVRAKLALVGLEEVEEKMPSDLSGGMKKRAALARSLALDPEAMLFDEPTTGLDPITSATIGRLIHSIQVNLGVSSVVVTHDVALARRIGDRLAFLDEGRFVFLGDWQEADASGPRSLADFLTGREEIAHAA